MALGEGAARAGASGKTPPGRLRFAQQMGRLGSVRRASRGWGLLRGRSPLQRSNKRGGLNPGRLFLF